MVKDLTTSIVFHKAKTATSYILPGSQAKAGPVVGVRYDMEGAATEPSYR